MVQTVGVWRGCIRAGTGWRAAQCEVPFEDVGFDRCGAEVGAGVFGEFLGFAEDATDGRVFGVQGR